MAHPAIERAMLIALISDGDPTDRGVNPLPPVLQCLVTGGHLMLGRANRRAFIAALGGAAAWPVVARAQGERVRRIGVLMNLTADDLEASARFNALAQGLQQLGWIVGRNVQIEHR